MLVPKRFEVGTSPTGQVAKIKELVVGQLVI